MSQPVLYSTFHDYAWEHPNMQSHALPGKDDQFGLYGVLEDGESLFLSHPDSSRQGIIAQGAVDIYGRIREHDDGVVRAEFMRLLALRLVVLPCLLAKSCSHSVDEGIGPNRFFVKFCTNVQDVQIVSGRNETVESLEKELITKYEIGHLPIGQGPWLAPWGNHG